MSKKPGPSTISVHLASPVDPATRAIVTPVSRNSAFAFENLAEWRAVALGEKPGDMYSRNTNPTTNQFEAKNGCPGRRGSSHQFFHGHGRDQHRAAVSFGAG